jgi:hypothetical protein
VCADSSSGAGSQAQAMVLNDIVLELRRITRCGTCMGQLEAPTCRCRDISTSKVTDAFSHCACTGCEEGQQGAPSVAQQRLHPPPDSIHSGAGPSPTQRAPQQLVRAFLAVTAVAGEATIKPHAQFLSRRRPCCEFGVANSRCALPNAGLATRHFQV